MKKTASLGILLSFAAGLAQAAGPEPVVVEAPVAAPVIPADPFWAGGYVGAQIGYAYGEFDFDAATSPGDFNNDSVIGGITAGYLWQVSEGWYLGPEFQYDFADITATDSATGDTATFEEIARLKLIVGREVGNGLLYGSAGIAYASLDDAGAVFDGLDGSDTSYVVGFGYDYRLNDNWTIGGEYMFHKFNGISSSGGDLDLNTVHIKTSYRF